MKITDRALIQRINRKLKQNDEQLRTARTARAESSIGHYFIVDVRRNVIVTHHLDLEELGRQLGVLQPWEATK